MSSSFLMLDLSVLHLKSTLVPDAFSLWMFLHTLINLLLSPLFDKLNRLSYFTLSLQDVLSNPWIIFWGSLFLSFLMSPSIFQYSFQSMRSIYDIPALIPVILYLEIKWPSCSFVCIIHDYLCYSTACIFFALDVTLTILKCIWFRRLASTKYNI